MADKSREEAWKFYAQTYDATMRDWPGEMDFYKRLAAEAHTRGESVLELACGTGRVAIRLAREGICVVGLDVSKSMVERSRPVKWCNGIAPSSCRSRSELLDQHGFLL